MYKRQGYVFTGWEVQGEETGHWDADAKTFGIAGLAHFPEGSDEGYVTVTAQFEKAEPEEKEARDVKVTFNVDPEKGEFTDPAGAEYVNFTIKEDDGEQYNVCLLYTSQHLHRSQLESVKRQDLHLVSASEQLCVELCLEITFL